MWCTLEPPTMAAKGYGGSYMSYIVTYMSCIEREGVCIQCKSVPWNRPQWRRRVVWAHQRLPEDSRVPFAKGNPQRMDLKMRSRL